MPTIRLTTTVAADPTACFDLSLSVDAHTASMGRSGERTVDGRRTGVLGPGETVTWAARHFGIPFEMTAQIVEHERPARFVDVQTRGPFARWHHEHTFDATPEGTTLMVDTIDFASPLGPVGALVDRVVLTRYLTRLIESRNRWLQRTLADTD